MRKAAVGNGFLSKYPFHTQGKTCRNPPQNPDTIPIGIPMEIPRLMAVWQYAIYKVFIDDDDDDDDYYYYYYYGPSKMCCRLYRVQVKDDLFDLRYCDEPSRGGERRRRRARLESFDSAWLCDCRVEDLFRYDHAGWAPIHYVAFHGHYEATEAVISAVPQLVDLRTADAFCVTPLMLAAMGNQLELVRLLLNHGADLAAVDRSAPRSYTTSVTITTAIHISGNV